MFIIVCGGGTVGYHLAQELLDRGNEVVVLEKNAVRARELHAELGGMVLAHDACEGRWLQEAGVKRAQLVCAMTGHDEDNLIIAQLAMMLAGEDCRIIARVNDPENAAVFRTLGITEMVSATDLVLSMIERDVSTGGGVVHLMRLQECGHELVEFRFAPESRALSRPLRELKLADHGCSVCAVIRGGAIIPLGPDLELDVGDEMVALVEIDRFDEVRKYLIDPEFKVEIS